MLLGMARTWSVCASSRENIDANSNVIQFHYHNLIHKDHEMMAAFNIIALAELGYDEKTRFLDPIEEHYCAKMFSESDLSSRSGDFNYDQIEKKCKFFSKLEAYKSVGETEKKHEEYWKTRAPRDASTMLTT